MKKIKFVFVFLFVVSLSLIGSEEVSISDNSFIEKNILPSFFDTITKYIGSSVVVYISDVDMIIRGELLSVYSDGILVNNLFKQTIFISKKSISYIEVKTGNDKK